MPDTVSNGTTWIGRSAPRLDGLTYTKGDVRYSADLVPTNALWVALVRSTHARATISGVDVDGALALPGVVVAVDGSEAARLCDPMPQALPFPLTEAEKNARVNPEVAAVADRTQAQALERPVPAALPSGQRAGGRSIIGRCLAIGVVNYVGQPVVAVVASTRQIAEDAAGRVVIHYESLDPVLDAEHALREGSAVVHSGWASNLVAADRVQAGDAEAAIRAAAHVVRGTVAFRPSTACPLEPLCYVGDWDARTGRLTLIGTFQNPHTSRWQVATSLRLRESDVRVVVPAMGGTFGFKMAGHTEEALVGLLSRMVGRPVAYVESRRDTLLGQSREQVHRFEIAADATGRIVAFRDEFVADVGTIGPGNGWTMPLITGAVFPTVYDVPNVAIKGTLVATNKAPWQPVRGYGKEIANLVMERAVDLLAIEAGLDPADLRARNLIKSDALPRRLPSGLNVDSGDYPEALERLKKFFGYEAWRERRTASAGSDRRIGVGFGFELTPEGGARPGAFPSGFETATVRMSPTGDVQVAVGVTSPGSGNETGIAQIVAGVLGLAPEQIRVIQGDTDAVPVGTGNASSRALLYGGAAAHLAATDLRGKLAVCAGNVLRAKPEDIAFSEGHARAPGGGAVSLTDLALGAHTHPFTVGEGVELPLEVTRSYRARNIRVTPDENGRIATYSSFPYSVHAAAVEVDRGTGRVTVLDIAVIHDCGVIVNPALVTGQIKGAVAMGIGAALWEELTFDGGGRLTSDRLKTYLLPRTTDLPTIRVGHMSTPSPFHPLGMKGAGESGFGGSLAAVTNAVGDALGSAAARLTVVPATPTRVMAALAGSAVP